MNLETLFFKQNKTPERRGSCEDGVAYVMQSDPVNRAVLSTELAPSWAIPTKQVEALVDSLPDNLAKEMVSKESLQQMIPTWKTITD